jgi:hypothetical protein
MDRPSSRHRGPLSFVNLIAGAHHRVSNSRERFKRHAVEYNLPLQVPNPGMNDESKRKKRDIVVELPRRSGRQPRAATWIARLQLIHD